jgi:hypothetical protein
MGVDNTSLHFCNIVDKQINCGSVDKKLDFRTSTTLRAQ